ncbi:MAG: CoA transferase [SAR202 cluster bacterium]|nr:CoA transferase [SAR202 cluster bacterium]
MSETLQGVKVLEIANWVAAPSACAMLADMGAEVIKIEPPETGDAVRSLGITTKGIGTHEGGVNVTFEQLNRGKQSMGINLEVAEAQETIRQLATTVDVLVTNLTPHRQLRYGVTYEDIVAVNPRIVYLNLTGYGMEGPERDRSGFDYAAFWARSGIMATLGELGEPPVQQRPGFGDQTTSLAMVAAVGMALFERELSGKGQRMDCALLDTALLAYAPDLVASMKDDAPTPRNNRKQAANALFNFYETKDGKWIQLVMIQSVRFWEGFCRALDIEHLTNDARFESHEARTENSAELLRIVTDLFAQRTRDEWAVRLDEGRCIWAPVQTLDEIGRDPQVLANEYTTTLEHAEDGEFRVVQAPMKFHRTPAAATSPAPELGQHTESVLLDHGYTWDDISALKDAGAII